MPERISVAEPRASAARASSPARRAEQRGEVRERHDGERVRRDVVAVYARVVARAETRPTHPRPRDRGASAAVSERAAPAPDPPPQNEGRADREPARAARGRRSCARLRGTSRRRARGTRFCARGATPSESGAQSESTSYLRSNTQGDWSRKSRRMRAPVGPGLKAFARGSISTCSTCSRRTPVTRSTTSGTRSASASSGRTWAAESRSHIAGMSPVTDVDGAVARAEPSRVAAGSRRPGRELDAMGGDPALD